MLEMMVDQKQRQLWWLPSAPVGRVIVESHWMLLKWNKIWTAQQTWTIDLAFLVIYFLRYRNVKITMLDLTLDSSSGQCWTVVMKKDACKSTSVQALWYTGKYIFLL